MTHDCKQTLVLAAVVLAVGIVASKAPAQRYGAGAATTAGAQPVDECQVVARVDGEVILAGEVLWQVNLMLDELAGRYPPEQEETIRQGLIQRQLMPLLDERMAYADFRRSEIGAKVNMKAIHEDLDGRFEEHEVPRLMKALGVDDQRALQARLLELGTTLEARRKSYYHTAIAQFWLRESVKQDGGVRKDVTHQELLDYYHAHHDEYEFPTQARWEELMLSYARCGSREEAWRRLGEMGNQAWKLAMQAKDPSQPVFTEIAKEKSQGFTAAEGGVHEWTTKGALADAILDEAIFTLRPGEMSWILESERGCHIVRVLERKQAGRTPFTEVQSEIRDAIQNQRMQEALKEKVARMRKTTRFWTVFTGPLDRSEGAKTAARDGAEVQ